jgi:hypothetical protein
LDKNGVRLRKETNQAYVSRGKDVTMYQDAARTTGHEDRLVVEDLNEPGSQIIMNVSSRRVTYE